MRIRDVAFQKVFQKFLIYNVLFEDAEVDEEFLGVDEDASVLSITGAGCGAAGVVGQRADSLDAVDINLHHLALTALKITAMRRLSYDTFYELLGRGTVADPFGVIKYLGRHMPLWARDYWLDSYERFSENLYREGLTARMFRWLRRALGLDAGFLRRLSELSLEERLRRVDETFAPLAEHSVLTSVLSSPIQMLSMGINYEQLDRLLETEGEQNLAELVVSYLRRLARTDLETNWFAWLGVAGCYNHAREDALPPYLRRDRWRRAQDSSTDVRYHHEDIFDVLAEAPRETWTHYTLCDMPDWLPPETQESLLDEILRTSVDGAIFQYRTVADDCVVERHGMENHFQRLDARSERATRRERTRLYRHVHFYRVRHCP